MLDLSCINLLQGTNSDREFSRGNTLPIVARPWGLHHWTLQTGQSPWTFNQLSRRLQGVRLTHQPSPWMRDYCSLAFLPFTGPVQDSPEHQASAYRVEDCVLRPEQLQFSLLRYGIDVKLTSTERGALVVLRFRPGVVPRVAFYFDGEHTFESIASNRIAGNSWDHRDTLHESFRLNYLADFSVEPVDVVQTEFGGYVEFSQDTESVEMRMAGSFISGEIAALSLKRELIGRSFEQIADEGESRWLSLLGRIRISPKSADQAARFYSCLYRCLLFPRFLDELDAEGKVVHRSPSDGVVYAGPLCADSGFWDAYRTLYPLLALVYPDVLNRMMEGWLNACRQCSWAPKWPSPGPRACMIGTHYDVVVADAVCKGVTDWDVEEAFSYLWKNATEPSDDSLFGREGLQDYIDLGYLPADQHPHSVCCTLDYAYNDFAVAQVARYLGKHEQAKSLGKRTQSYRNVFDAEVGFMRGRLMDGQWETPFREFAWGGAFIEGGPWQHVFNVPHDHEGLAACFGGAHQVCEKLDEMLSSESRFEAGTYNYEIHEATEMALAGFGQYAHGNQPVHAFLFLYGLLGQPQKMQYWIRRVCEDYYSKDDFPGDEDNGEMSAWYIWSALGLFPFCPGKPEYIMFEPLIGDWKITVGETEICSSELQHVAIDQGSRIISHDVITSR
ncbi:GH92 family glycosyl hydrolase [Coraliomargarita sp. SDUM461004]|uniref:GH92 family glycosyl hydrolase n=1 Tax=Thalassobacterium sedimentorum TaxID=3041258 RepID=A0ABU1APN1_9BACT|nr:GH92 family glycosyl hydrolase [Coraliomargarita sp. SDUM461004]MDQ8195711.1 GH92 family glycosyl hydrolase [Coraliomargarita sp. SDUM461004]